jgi:putative transcriptional regulator
MTKLSERELAAWERGRDPNTELREALEQARRGEWARKTEFLPQPDGALRRRVTRRDGTVEKDELIPPAQVMTRAARAATGLSQAEFARLLGVSRRTVQEWEQGRKTPTGAAASLLKVAARRPDVLCEVLAEW